MAFPDRPRQDTRQTEPIRSKELAPRSGVVDALRGTISEPHTVISRKLNEAGKLVQVQVVENGSGQFGLTDLKDNKDWAGIFGHSVLSARYSVHLGRQLLEAEAQGRVRLDENNQPNTQTMLDGMIVSHAGRRTWDEAGWYPDITSDAAGKREVSNETIGLRIIEGKVPDDAFRLVTALAHKPEGFEVDSEMLDSMTYKITSYVDHRTTDRWQPLRTRLGDFLLNNFFEEDQRTDETKEHVYEIMEAIIEQRKNFVFGTETEYSSVGGLPPEDISVDVADVLAQELGASEGSERLTRRDLMALVIQDAETEARLQAAGIDTENINDETVPMESWEKKVREDYVVAAKDGIVARISELHLQFDDGNESAMRTIDQEFPIAGGLAWWGKTARELYVTAA